MAAELHISRFIHFFLFLLRILINSTDSTDLILSVADGIQIWLGYYTEEYMATTALR